MAQLLEHCAVKAEGSTLAAAVVRDMWFQAIRRAFGATPQSFTFGGRSWWVFTADEDELKALREMEQQLDTSGLCAADLERVFAVAAFPSTADARPELDSLEDDVTKLLTKKFGSKPPEGELLQHIVEDSDFDLVLHRFDEIWRMCKALELAGTKLLRNGFAEDWQADPEAIGKRCADEIRVAISPRCSTALRLKMLVAASQPARTDEGSREKFAAATLNAAWDLHDMEVQHAAAALKQAVLEEIFIRQRSADEASSPTISDQVGLRMLWPVILTVPDCFEICRLEREYPEVFAIVGCGRKVLEQLLEGGDTHSFRSLLCSFGAAVKRDVRRAAHRAHHASAQKPDAYTKLCRMVEQLGSILTHEGFTSTAIVGRQFAIANYLRVAIVVKELARRSSCFFRPDGVAGRHPYGSFTYMGEPFHALPLEDIYDLRHKPDHSRIWHADLRVELGLDADMTGGTPFAVLRLLKEFGYDESTASAEKDSDQPAESTDVPGTPTSSDSQPDGMGLDGLRETVSVRLGDIRFARDATCIEFADRGRHGTLHDLVRLFSKTPMPEWLLHRNLIEVVPFGSRGQEEHLFSADSRRLFAMRAAYPLDQMVQVYKYKDVAAYNAAHWISWEQVFTSVTDGRSVRLQPRGHIQSLGSLFERNVLVRILPDPEQLERWKRCYKLDAVRAETCDESGLKFVVLRGGRAEVDKAGRWLSRTQDRPTATSARSDSGKQHTAELGNAGSMLQSLLSACKGEVVDVHCLLEALARSDEKAAIGDLTSLLNAVQQFRVPPLGK